MYQTWHPRSKPTCKFHTFLKISKTGVGRIPFPLQPTLQSWWNPAGGAGTDWNLLENEEPEKEATLSKEQQTHQRDILINKQCWGKFLHKTELFFWTTTKVIRTPRWEPPLSTGSQWTRHHQNERLVSAVWASEMNPWPRRVRNSTTERHKK